MWGRWVSLVMFLFAISGTQAVGQGSPGVKADWLMDEASTQIVDSKSGITLIENINAGVPKEIYYSQTITGPYAAFGPCVEYGSVSDNHDKLSASSKLDIDNNDDFVFEWLVEKNTVHFPDYHFSLGGGANANDYGVVAFHRSATELDVAIKTDDGTTASKTFTVTDLAGTPSFYQLYCDRASSCELFQDKASKGSFSITGLSGKKITNTAFRMGGQFNGGTESLDGTMCRFRISIGNNVLGNSLI